MKISTKGRYALRMMVDLAEHMSDGYVSLKEISERQGVSKKYLEQIVPLLNKSDMLKRNRGYQGGYMLMKGPSEYSVGEILRTTEGNLCPVDCLQYSPNECPRVNECQTLYVWQGLYSTITNYLDNITLQDIVEHSLDGDDYSI